MDNKALGGGYGKKMGALWDAVVSFICRHVSPDTEKSSVQEAMLDFSKRFLYGIGTAALAYAFGGAELVMGVKPMGTALLCASERRVLCCYSGLVLSALLSRESALPYIIVYTLLLAARYIISRRLSTRGEPFGESIVVRALSGGFGGFGLGMLRMISGGMLYYDMLGAVFETVITPVGVWLMSGALDRKKRQTAAHEIGIAALMLCSVFSVRGARLFGFDISAVFAFVLSAYAAARGGVLRGGVAGFLCGLAYRAIYAPAFGIGGLCLGALYGASRVAAICVSACAVSIYAVSVSGYTALYSFAPDIIAASLISFVLSYLAPPGAARELAHGETVPRAVLDGAAVAGAKEACRGEQMSKLSDAMGELSDVFLTLSDKLRVPGAYDVRSLCEHVCLQFCDRCNRRAVCWEEESEYSEDALTKLRDTLLSKGKVEPGDADEHFLERCDKSDFLISRINDGYSELLEQSLRTDKLKVYALDYLGISRLLSEAVGKRESEYVCDEEASSRCRRSAEYMRFRCNNVVVYGSRRKRLIAGGVDIAENRSSADELRRVFSNSCGVKLSLPEYSATEEYVTMTMEAVPIIRVRGIKRSRCKREESMNGDSICSFSSPDDYYYTLISDGMGSGREAALSSRISAVFLEKLLRCGVGVGAALELLNNLLRDKSGESFSTIDLLEVDLLSGRASFTKSGAAPSFILRDGNLFRIDSESVPVGIMRETNAEEIRFELVPGDIIVMLSDGILSGVGSSLWLCELLSLDISTTDALEAIAEKIIERAQNEQGAGDDMTVGIMLVEAA